MSPVLLTVEQAAEALALGRTKVYELLDAGALRSIKIGRARRIPVEALQEFVRRVPGHGLTTQGVAMTARKPNRRSSVFKAQDGRWHGYVSIGIKADGSLDRRHRTGRTQAEVTRKVQELERQRDAGQVAKAGRPRRSQHGCGSGWTPSPRERPAS